MAPPEATQTSHKKEWLDNDPVIDQEYADIQRNTPGPVKMLALSHGRYAKDIDEFRTNKSLETTLLLSRIMAEAPALSVQIVRGLNDRVYEKRKAAALEIEKLIRTHFASNNVEKIKSIIEKLTQDFAYSAHQNSRNGGLIGLAAAAIALGPDVAPYLDDIATPVLHCFTDQESRVRYYACESMYNIAKVSKGEILRYFNEIFDAMSKLAADADLPVKNGTELLDRLIKDIAAEQSTTYVSVLDAPSLVSNDDQDFSTDPMNIPRTTAFSLPKFIPLLAERIRVKNPFTRLFLVSWITVLDSIPDLELVSFLPDFLDGLINFLSDPNEAVCVSTSNVLANFLTEIREAVEVKEQQKQQAMKIFYVEQQRKFANLSENNSETGDSLKDGTVTNSSVDDDNSTLVKSVDAGDAFWDSISISEMEGKGKGTWVPGQSVEINFTRIIEILMPHLSSSVEQIQETALKWINEFINIAKEVVISFTPQLISAVLPSLAHSVPNILSYQYVKIDSNSVVDTSPLIEEEVDPFDYRSTVRSLVDQFINSHEETRIASLDLLIMLHKKAPKKILAFDDGYFPNLLELLLDPSEEVAKRDLQLLAQLSSSSQDEYFPKFMVDLLKLFATDRKLLENRGSLIIRHLCLSLNSERIYMSFAEILEKEEDIEFASNMVQNLNSILITSPELSDLRRRLKHLEAKDGQMLFTALYKSWCHNPVATFSLYKYPHLVKCLYGLLMLLPQSSAFASLKNRLTSVSSMGFLHLMPKSPNDSKKSISKLLSSRDEGIRFQDLLTHFKTVQTKHETIRKQARTIKKSNTTRRRRNQD
ncbi:8567_t:CDS:10 [Entrophospora sp. SA101]|nr:11789_t:CDS:10 [Entrophospora sp. SA101]CAJ0863620.1 7251_t:CDS:10 [Entrophospora sp. SA101]CAJ0907932.1 8567_t:CDS:10 [Entrophospora sp. SA101]